MAWDVHPDYGWLKCPTCGAALEMGMSETKLLSGNVSRQWWPRNLRCPAGHKVPPYDQLRAAHFGPSEGSDTP